MNMKKLASMAASVALVAAGAGAQINWTGAGTNQWFSNAGNWSAAPSAGVAIQVADVGTSASSPAQVDAAWNWTNGNITVGAAIVGAGAGYGYVEVLDGAKLRGTSYRIGSVNDARPGYFTVRSGGSIDTTASNNGQLLLGRATAGSGIMVVEAGASLRIGSIVVNGTGVLQYRFGADSVSTYVSARITTGQANTINGKIVVDLGDLKSAGEYTLIDSSTNTLLIAGSLKNWLDGSGGVFSGTGPFSTNHFEVVNAAADLPWELRLAEGGQDLVFAALADHSYIPPVVVGASKDTTLRNSAGENRADLGLAPELFVHGNEFSRGLLEFDLSGATDPITNAVLTLVQTENRIGTWTFDVYPMVYTTNNYGWFEGSGTNQWGNNTTAPASATGAACYLYSKDDAVQPTQWQDGSVGGVNNAGNAALWGAVIGTVSGTNSVAGQEVSFTLDASVLESLRTNGVGRIVFGVWGATALDGNHFFASKENSNSQRHPRLTMMMEAEQPPPVAPDITSISAVAVGGGTAATVAFDAMASASLWFTPNLVFPAWTNVASGASPLGYTNSAPAGFYKVTIP